MYLCYIDESGTPEVPGTTSHYVLAALAIPIYKWKSAEDEISRLKQKYDLLSAEVHAGWLIRTYPEQNNIAGFELLLRHQRKSEVERLRRAELLRLQGKPSLNKQLKQLKKNYSNNIIETPLFVDSSLTSMIQMADVCSYAIRRYLENNETGLFDEIFKRADRKGATVVGIRHFSANTCKCKICVGHKSIR